MNKIKEDYFDGVNQLKKLTVEGEYIIFFQKDGFLHREDGPALINFTPLIEDCYYLWGEMYDTMPNKDKIEKMRKEYTIESVLL